MINSELKAYIENNIFPQYSKNEEGHGINHIKKVIERSFKLANGYDVNLDMVYVIASYHDIGHYIDKDKHEEISADIMYNDNKLKKWFDENDRVVIKEAIEDHRASLKREPRSIYGKIISSADRTIMSIDDSIKRTYLYGKKHEKDYTEEQLINRVYTHLKEKYGEDGYAKCYIKDDEFNDAITNLRNALSDKESFLIRVNEVIKEIKI